MQQVSRVACPPLVHVLPRPPAVILPPVALCMKLSLRMGFTRTQVAIAASAAALLVFGFLGYIWWLSNQGPVLARSEERDSLSGLPVSIRMNPLRDRTIEHSANLFLRQLRDGRCDQLLSAWEHDYRKKYAHFICDSEAQHPLLSWELADWESAPPLTILHYHGKRLNQA